MKNFYKEICYLIHLVLLFTIFFVWFLTILLVKVSGFKEAGLFSLATSVTAAPAIIGLFNIRSFQVSDLKNEYKDKTYIFSRNITNILSFIICLIVVFIGRYSKHKAFIIFAFMVFKMTESTADVYYGIEQKNGRLDYTGVSLIIRGIGAVVLFYIVYLLSKNLLISILSMAIFSLIIIKIYDRRKVILFNLEENNVIDLKEINKLLFTCLPLAMAAFLNNLSISIPRIFLEKYFGTETMGIYFSIASPTQVVQLVATTLFAPLIPILTNKFYQEDISGFGKILKKFSLLAVILSFICLIGSYFFAKPILILMFGSEIVPYVNLFIPVIIVSILIGINSCMMSICVLMRIVKGQCIVGVVGVISTIIMSVFIVEKYSMKGVTTVTIVTMLIQMVIQIFLILKISLSSKSYSK